MLEPNYWEILKSRELSTAMHRDVDRRAIEHYRMNSLVLMENAGINCVRWLEIHFPQRPRTVILCGPGNNGGDGVVIARHLRTLGWPCRCFVLGPLDRLSSDNQQNCRILLSEPNSRLSLLTADGWQPLIDELRQADLILDAMLGTGASGNPRHPIDQWILAANACQATRVSIDLPTGIDADSGRLAQPHFKADFTLTFVARKLSMNLQNATELFGSIEVLPIGICETQIRELLAATQSLPDGNLARE